MMTQVECPTSSAVWCASSLTAEVTDDTDRVSQTESNVDQTETAHLVAGETSDTDTRLINSHDTNRRRARSPLSSAPSSIVDSDTDGKPQTESRRRVASESSRTSNDSHVAFSSHSTAAQTTTEESVSTGKEFKGAVSRSGVVRGVSTDTAETPKSPTVQPVNRRNKVNDESVNISHSIERDVHKLARAAAKLQRRFVRFAASRSSRSVPLSSDNHNDNNSSSNSSSSNKNNNSSSDSKNYKNNQNKNNKNKNNKNKSNKNKNNKNKNNKNQNNKNQNYSHQDISQSTSRGNSVPDNFSDPSVSKNNTQQSYGDNSDSGLSFFSHEVSAESLPSAQLDNTGDANDFSLHLGSMRGGGTTPSSIARQRAPIAGDAPITTLFEKPLHSYSCTNVLQPPDQHVMQPHDFPGL
ncbi:MAG: hypothetical protein MHM6MM_003935 [Cercozoa sp. M6MM]